jgi:transposase
MVMAKQDGRKLDHKSLETLRVIAVRRVVEDGERPSEVMRSLGLCRTSIYPWLRAHSKKGPAALLLRKSSGPRCKLNARQCQRVRRWVLGKDPRQHGFDFGLWTRRIVAQLIEEKLGIRLELTAVGRLLAGLEITPQKPLRRAYERDPKAVEQWLAQGLPAPAAAGPQARGDDLLSGRGGLQFRTQSGKNLRTQRADPGGQDHRATAEGQCHQRGQREGRVLEPSLHRDVQRRTVC